MATAEEIRAKIATVQRDIESKKQEKVQTAREVDEAIERQRLRRELDNLESTKEVIESDILNQRWMRMCIDRDEVGPHTPDGMAPSSRLHGAETTKVRAKALQNKAHEELQHNSIIATGEYMWTICEMSWLMDAMEDEGDFVFSSIDPFEIGDCEFTFQYTPTGGDDGTLAIRPKTKDGSVIFRYKVYIKRKGGDFVQWGRTGQVCRPDDNVNDIAFGPDVIERGGNYPQGIFGLSHKELLDSEWCENDTLTARFELEVRLPISYPNINAQEVKIQIPAVAMSADLLSILDTGKGSDVAFVVRGESINAHSQILASRSEVFDKLLNGGMRESISREVHIDDCSAATFKALLRFLYTDDFVCIDEAMQKEIEVDQSSSRSIVLQNLLAVSDKYSLSRLQAWCEQKLSECITNNEVCSILVQAELYQAKQLSKVCLDYIRKNYENVIVTESFGRLGKDCPDIMLKINLSIAGVPETRATTAIEASSGCNKRKRCEEF